MKPGNKNSYKSLTSININEKEYKYFSLKILQAFLGYLGTELQDANKRRTNK